MKLKYCQITEEVISAALWMPFGNFNRCLNFHYHHLRLLIILFISYMLRAFRTAYPVVGRKHSFGVPTMYKAN